MLSSVEYLSFVLASIIVAIVPGPTVTVIIANSLRGGTKAGLLNVAGTQLGVLSSLLIVALGLDFILSQMAVIFDVLRIAGAAYLIWLGVKMLRSNGKLGEAAVPKGHSYFWQGFIVLWSNPKALLFLGAFIPQFVNPEGDAVSQTLLLGFTFMAVAGILDSCYALVAGKAGGLLSRSNIRKVEWFSGSALIGGGLWLAFQKS
ncbi:MAG: LysE family translocator [Gammaproteobacteria bacterium]